MVTCTFPILLNGPGRFILCLVRDGEGKRHRLIFPEGKGLVKGWLLLEEKLHALGIKETQGKIVTRRQAETCEGITKEGPSGSETAKPQRCVGIAL